MHLYKDGQLIKSGDYYEIMEYIQEQTGESLAVAVKYAGYVIYNGKHKMTAEEV